MPIHDWTRATAGVFHCFHCAWITEIQKCLNDGRLPKGYYALSEQVAGTGVPDENSLMDVGEVPIFPEPSEAVNLAVRRRRIVIRRESNDRVIALVELVSPGSKESKEMVSQFAAPLAAARKAGLQLLLIDLFAPGPFDPNGLHGSLMKLAGLSYEQPAGKPLVLASYAADEKGLSMCYVEPTAVGTPLIDMPLFLTADRYVNVPLEQTYLAAYRGVPQRWKPVIEGRAAQ